MEKYLIKISDKNIINDINEGIENAIFRFGTNYTSDESVYKAVLEYSKKHEQVNAYCLTEFDYTKTTTKKFLQKEGSYKWKKVIVETYHIIITDEDITVNGHTMPFQYKYGYTLKLLERSIQTFNVTHFAELFVGDLWDCYKNAIVHHVLKYGKINA